jgi:FAD/FMN-containing dehydrogenase
VLSMRRLNRVRRVDAANDSMIVEAGCTLMEAQAAARAADRLFPLSLGSEGTAQIGGNLSTNAGGTAVLRYGMMRDLVLGLEVVLADGRLLSGLKSLRKDNTGYDVKSLFIGAEGTLGVITAASLKLFPLPADTATALVGIDSPQDALALLARLRRAAGDQVTTFELMPKRAVELTVEHVPGVANPLSQGTPWYLLIEFTSPNPRQALDELMTHELHQAAEAGTVRDALIAASMAQSQAMWKLRESVPEAQRHHGASLKHDVSVPISAVPRLIDEGSALVRALVPEPAFQCEPAARYRQRRVSETRQAARASHLRFGRQSRRQHQRRTRHRAIEDRRIFQALRSGRVVGNAFLETHARSEGHLESRQGSRLTTALASPRVLA